MKNFMLIALATLLVVTFSIADQNFVTVQDNTAVFTDQYQTLAFDPTIVIEAEQNATSSVSNISPQFSVTNIDGGFNSIYTDAGFSPQNSATMNITGAELQLNSIAIDASNDAGAIQSPQWFSMNFTGGAWFEISPQGNYNVETDGNLQSSMTVAGNWYWSHDIAGTTTTMMSSMFGDSNWSAVYSNS